MNADPTTRIRVEIDGDDYGPTETTLSDFIRDNDLTPDEIAELVDDLAHYDRHIGGGGASPIFTVTKA